MKSVSLKASLGPLIYQGPLIPDELLKSNQIFHPKKVVTVRANSRQSFRSKSMFNKKTANQMNPRAQVWRRFLRQNSFWRWAKIFLAGSPTLLQSVCYCYYFCCSSSNFFEYETIFLAFDWTTISWVGVRGNWVVVGVEVVVGIVCSLPIENCNSSHFTIVCASDCDLQCIWVILFKFI